MVRAVTRACMRAFPSIQIIVHSCGDNIPSRALECISSLIRMRSVTPVAVLTIISHFNLTLHFEYYKYSSVHLHVQSF